MSKVYMGVEPAGGFASELPHNSDPDGHSEATRGVLGQVDERGRHACFDRIRFRAKWPDCLFLSHTITPVA